MYLFSVPYNPITLCQLTILITSRLCLRSPEPLSAEPLLWNSCSNIFCSTKQFYFKEISLHTFLCYTYLSYLDRAHTKPVISPKEVVKRWFTCITGKQRWKFLNAGSRSFFVWWPSRWFSLCSSWNVNPPFCDGTESDKNSL